jgi:hypothetical protein
LRYRLGVVQFGRHGRRGLLPYLQRRMDQGDSVFLFFLNWSPPAYVTVKTPNTLYSEGRLQEPAGPARVIRHFPTCL